MEGGEAGKRQQNVPVLEETGVGFCKQKGKTEMPAALV